VLSRTAQFFASKAMLTLPLWIAVVAFGSLAYTTLLPREGFPSVQIPLAVVSGGYFVEDREQVDADVLVPVNEALSSLDQVDSVTTNARANSFVAIVELTDEVDSAGGAELVSEALAEADLPEQAVLSVDALEPAKFLNKYDLLVGITGPADATAAQLEEAAKALEPLLETSSVVVDAEMVELFSRGMNPATGEEVVTESSFNQSSVVDNGTNVLRPSITIGVLADPDVDALGLRDGVDEVLADAPDVLDGEFEAFVAVDFATQIRQQIGSLQGNVLTGLVAVALIALLLISFRASIITALFILTVLAVSTGVLYLVGISLNTISLFGIILALGLFVDDAIVITEAIDAFRDKSGNAIAGIGRAIRRVGLASASGTVTTVLVFAPMLAISGILGEFIRVLPQAVIIALVTSLVLSLIFIPFAARYLILSAPKSASLPARALDKAAAGVASMSAATGAKGLAYIIGGVTLSLVMIGIGLFGFAPRVGFNIFPPQSDANAFEVDYTFPPGSTIEESRAITLAVNQELIEELGDDFVEAYTYLGDANSATVQFTVTEVGSDRDPLPTILDEQLEPIVAAETGARVNVRMLSAGPPEEEFPFLMQVYNDDPAVLASAAPVLQAALDGATIDAPNGTTFNVTETTIALSDVVARQDGRRLVEIRAAFDSDEVTTVTQQTAAFMEEQFGADELAALGLEDDALGFDFGLESENRESFGSLRQAFGLALIAMLILLIVQFRSLVQWLLVFLAIPFGFFGVFGGLLLTGNSLSFFVMLGLLGLIGIAVNNTILLVDFANQERRAGATRSEAIEAAVRQRFRPLVATSLTTVAGILPLALSDPFWEALGFTIVFGLLSSTFLVLLSFPAYYLLVETARDMVVTPWRYQGGGSADRDLVGGDADSSGDATNGSVDVSEQPEQGESVTV
jgi:multidrug efflux pump subunit AcrB